MSAYVVTMVGPSGSFDTTCSAVDSQYTSSDDGGNSHTSSISMYTRWVR